MPLPRQAVEIGAGLMRLPSAYMPYIPPCGTVAQRVNQRTFSLS